MCEAVADRLLGGRVDDVKDVAIARQRAAEQDEPVVDERIHEPRVLIPAVLVAKLSRPVPGPAALESNHEQHWRHRNRASRSG